MHNFLTAKEDFRETSKRTLYLALFFGIPSLLSVVAAVVIPYLLMFSVLTLSPLAGVVLGLSLAAIASGGLLLAIGPLDHYFQTQSKDQEENKKIKEKNEWRDKIENSFNNEKGFNPVIDDLIKRHEDSTLFDLNNERIGGGDELYKKVVKLKLVSEYLEGIPALKVAPKPENALKILFDFPAEVLDTLLFEEKTTEILITHIDKFGRRMGEPVKQVNTENMPTALLSKLNELSPLCSEALVDLLTQHKNKNEEFDKIRKIITISVQYKLNNVLSAFLDYANSETVQKLVNSENLNLLGMAKFYQNDGATKILEAKKMSLRTEKTSVRIPGAGAGFGSAVEHSVEVAQRHDSIGHKK